ncbi:MAG: helix-turn-helix domain-containing protein [Chloroflexi bacterium]|nr:helix-turn-helix domain-containing protein [Chloroflexota bacterium]
MARVREPLFVTGLGQQVRGLRTTAGLTQAELAERAGISERAVSDIERGLRGRVYPETARRLAAALTNEPADAAAVEALIRGGQLSVPGGALDHATPEPASPASTSDQWAVLRRTALIGRDAEVRTVCAWLGAPNNRLVTITGPGGIGKSRLAAEVCARLIGESRTVLFVTLAALRDPALLLPAMAMGLGLPNGGTVGAPGLARHLRGRAAIVVLDSFEPVIDAAGEIGALLDQVADLQVLATSRAPLRLRGERELPLGPLTVRHGGESDPAFYPAEHLFLERARAARPDLEVNEITRAVVAEICARLGGLPLALELAAARVRHMSLAALRSELDRPLRLLAGGDRDLPARQRTMRATIDWSHDLLAPQQRAVFRGVSCFRGGWTLAAAETIVRIDEESGEDLLEAFGPLVEYGLVTVEHHAASPRWKLLDPIGDYASERLVEAGEEAATRRRHAGFFAALAEEAEPHLRGPQQSRWRDALREDVDNLRGALDWALASSDADLALRLAGALWMFWRLEGAFAEGRSWLDRALSVDGARGSAQRGRALWGAAWLAYQDSDDGRAATLATELLGIADDRPDSLDRRNALTVLGHVATARGRADEALPPLEDALAIAQRTGSAWHLAASRLNLGTALVHTGAVERAEDALEQAWRAFVDIGDRHFVGTSLVELGYAAIVAGDIERASLRFGAALREFAALDERWGLAEAIDAVATLEAARGEARTAAILSGAAEQAWATIASRRLAPDGAIAAPLLEDVRASIGRAEWDASLAEGRRLVLQAAVALALQQTPVPVEP